MTLQNAPPGLDYERDRKFSKVSIEEHHIDFASQIVVTLQEMLTNCSYFALL